MSGPVDVLAVLDEFALYVRNVSSRHALQGDILETRAAVAELINAADCFTCAIAEDSNYRDDLLSAIRELERASFVEQLNRVRSAIANLGGAK